jgi:hypothetical protein
MHLCVTHQSDPAWDVSQVGPGELLLLLLLLLRD